MLLHAQDYALGPDSQPQTGVPKGTVTKYKLEPGRLYPGTPHDYSVYCQLSMMPLSPGARVKNQQFSRSQSLKASRYRMMPLREYRR